jgi:DNA-binding XRE family transcriptional regulator
VSDIRRGIPAVHNDNLFPLVYTLEISLNLNELNPAYPREPKTLGERLRRARMGKNMLIREFAEQIGVTEDSVINWEKRGMKPNKRYLEKIENFIEVWGGGW